LVYSKKQLPLQKRLRTDKSVQEKKASEILDFDDDMNEKFDLSSDGKKAAVEDAESLIPVKDKHQRHPSEPFVPSKKSSGTKVDVKQRSEENAKLPLFDTEKLNLFIDTLKKKCSIKGASQGEYLDWITLGREVALGFWALPSHCTFAAGRWDSHVIESLLQPVNVHTSSKSPHEHQMVLVEAPALQQSSDTEPVLQQVVVNSTSKSAHEEQPSAVEAATLQQASKTVAVFSNTKLKNYFQDAKLFADLEKLHQYYSDWRLNNPGCDVKDGSPKYINNTASMNPEKVREHLERRIQNSGYNFTASDVLMKDYAWIYEEEDLDPTMPPIDHRLWTYREVVALIVEREQSPL